MINNQIKADHSADIEKFLANGGVIHKAVNSNKADFNYCNADTEQIAKRPNSHQNHVLRTRAGKQELKSYKPVAPCPSCNTSERSTRSNICLECDRRRARAKTSVNKKNIEAIGHHLLSRNEVVEFTSGGKKYILKVEVA